MLLRYHCPPTARWVGLTVSCCQASVKNNFLKASGFLCSQKKEGLFFSSGIVAAYPLGSGADKRFCGKSDLFFYYGFWELLADSEGCFIYVSRVRTSLRFLLYE
ncbi:hypothetical protein, partial [Treponema sp. R80B11-R83G3]